MKSTGNMVGSKSARVFITQTLQLICNPLWWVAAKQSQPPLEMSMLNDFVISYSSLFYEILDIIRCIYRFLLASGLEEFVDISQVDAYARSGSLG